LVIVLVFALRPMASDRQGWSSGIPAQYQLSISALTI
jgi:hypothetical protein